jgi:gamma-glutamylcyclotransferase (GGCT)/AIG2-like uncharacterized protein YtfP
VFYFAYGSNMDWAQMQRRCPSAKFVCVARLPNYCFAIARHSQLRKCGTANIFPETGSEVWGIVYEVSDRDLAILDGFEDGYRRELGTVHSSNDGDTPFEVLTYIAPRETDPPPPNPEYKRLILSGAWHWRLPENYCAMLEKIETGSL